MIVRNRPSALNLFFITRGSIVVHIAPQIIAAASFGGLVTYLHTVVPLPILTVIPFTLIGLALSIFLGFRNSACYDRYWEGRKLWGQLIINTRTFARQCTTLIGTNNDKTEDQDSKSVSRLKHRMIYKTIAFSHALRHHLRGTVPHSSLKKFLEPEDLEFIATRSNIPNAIVDLLARDLRYCLRHRLLSDMLAQNIDETITSMAGVLAGCERIRNTPLPFAYTLLLHRTAYLYCFLLPFGLVDTIGLMTPLVVAIVSYTFFGLDALGDEIEEPFGQLPNDLPLSAMCRTIEIDLRQQLGERNTPPPLQPVNYCLL
ncbi:MAG: bestrophin family protein [Gammaproteobacteria bacterium]|nr:bestrophin family protein [Gammaproteobacteria bacterium]